jgi:hypothetical protein
MSLPKGFRATRRHQPHPAASRSLLRGRIGVATLAVLLGAAVFGASCETDPEAEPDDAEVGSDPEDATVPRVAPGSETFEEPDPHAIRPVTGHHNGFTVPEGETWEIVGEVTTDANVVVEGTLRMRAGATLMFVDVDEGAFEGGGMDVIGTDVGLWVMGAGRLDVQGTPVQGWNRTGEHATWRPEHEYVIAPHDAPRDTRARPWQLGDEVPCTTFAGETYCAEVANLTRDVVIQGTEDGQSHIFIRSTQPQTIRHAVLRHMGPNGDNDSPTPGMSEPDSGPCCPDGRYAIHFHHAQEGSRGSVVEGVVIRDTGDHAFVPHESNGILFRDTVAFKVVNSPYWWDPGDEANDVRFDRALAIEVLDEGGRDSPNGNLAGFRLGKGEGNQVTNSAVAGGESPSGYLWRDGSPNNWVFDNNVAHHTNAGIFFWTNEHRDPDKVHEVGSYIGYRNSRAILHGAYQNRVHFNEIVSFENSHTVILQHAAPRGETGIIPGTLYRNGVLGGGYLTPRVIEITGRRNCEHPEGQQTLYADLWLVDFDGPPIYIDQDRKECRHEGDRMHIVFRDVVVGEERRPLEPDDLDVRNLPREARIAVENNGLTLFTIQGE